MRKQIIKKITTTLALSMILTLVTPNVLPMVHTVQTVQASTIKMNWSTLKLKVGKSAYLTVKGTKKKATWKSSDTSVVKVTSTGKATAIKHGKATITAKIDSKKYTCKITVPYADVNNDVYVIRDDVFARYRADAESFIIPEYVTKIENGAFQTKDNLKTVTIPNAVTKIGDYVFKNCVALTNIIIPDSVTELGENAFERCKSLTSIQLSNSLKEIKNYTFTYCDHLEEIVIPNSVTKIGYKAFSYTGAIKVTIPSSVTEIQEDAFYPATGKIVIIIGQSGSYAETYANANGFTFQAQ